MQRFAKAPKVIAAAFLVALVVIMSIVPTFAITPPQPTGAAGFYTGSQNITEEDAEAITRMVGEMKTLGFFQFGDFILVGRRGSTVRVLVSPSGYTLTNNGTTISVTEPSQLQMQEYNFVEGGFRLQVAVSGGVSYPLENVLCWWANDTLNINPDYSYGTAHSDSVITTSNAWHTYYEKVYNYDENLDAEYWNGYDVGFDDGRAEGLEEGEANAEQRYQQGVIDGQQAGYSAGYSEGQTIGYETGYRDGVDDTYPTAYQEGYDDGVAHGGGTTVITEELDIGSIISSLPQAAKNIINGALGFEIFGINVAGTLTAILVVAIVGFVIKWLMTR